MTHRSHACAALLVSTLSLQGCGGSPPEPTTPSASAPPPVPVPQSAPPPSPAPATPASASAEATPAREPTSPPADDMTRAQVTELIVQYVGSPEIDLHQQGRIAAAGLSEEPVYGLGVWMKALAAVVSSKIDPSQCETILRATVAEPAIRPDAEKRCGPLDALGRRVQGMPSDRAVKELAAACKIDGLTPDPGLRPWAVLSAALVEDHLAKAPDHTPEERAIARALRQVCAGDGAKP